MRFFFSCLFIILTWRFVEGIDYELGSREREVAESLLGLVKPAVKVISQDIYTNVYRCFFELLQNADDLQFNEGSIPCMRIEAFPNGLLISNNESNGFSAADVNAICAIGQSTKSGSDDTTGRKGIGFKSVFGLTSVTEVWSGSYQIRFDANKLGGEVIPEWVDSPPVASFPHGMTTHVWLAMDESVALARKLVDRFAPESLLFLRRIRRVSIHVTPVECISFSMDVENDEHTVKKEFLGTTQDQRMFYVVQDGECKLAFPDPLWFVKIDSEQRSFPVTTYLPVVDVGFPFVIQAPFLLTASREEIHEGDVVVTSKIAFLFFFLVFLFNFLHRTSPCVTISRVFLRKLLIGFLRSRIIWHYTCHRISCRPGGNRSLFC